MSPNEMKGAETAGASTLAPMLCVSIHDVAPATWPDCLRLVQAIRAVADIPLTWLVVPHYHFRPEQSPAMEACLDASIARGDELALHGYSHLDTEAAGGGGLRQRFLRNVYTQREGEFSALAEDEARRRIELGLEWFAARGWTPTGFVPPAWLLGEGAWRALRAGPFAYTTTACATWMATRPVEPRCCRRRWCTRRATAAGASCRRAWPTPPRRCWRNRRWCVSACTRRMRATRNWCAISRACWNACSHTARP
jgi:predicted deacetylase